MVIELMGHNAGWLTLQRGLAGGADIILIPEIPYDIDSICQHLTERRRRGKWFSIVAVAEGAAPEAARAGAPMPAEPGQTRRTRRSKKDKDKKARRTRRTGSRTQPAQRRWTTPATAGPARRWPRRSASRLGMETRVTVLGHLQRGGIPTPFDRVLATRFGTYAAEMLAQGTLQPMVCMKGSEVLARCRWNRSPARSSWCRPTIR